MQSNLVNFIQVLRTHEVRVSPAETLDAVDVAATLGYADRSLLRDGLAMTLAKTPEEEVDFPALLRPVFSAGARRLFRSGDTRATPDETSELITDQTMPPVRRQISLPPRLPRYNSLPIITRPCSPCCKLP